MDIRTGSARAASAFLGLVWIVTLSVATTEGYLLQAFGGLVVFTVGYLVACGVIRWVFNGFFPPPHA